MIFLHKLKITTIIVKINYYNSKNKLLSSHRKYIENV